MQMSEGRAEPRGGGWGCGGLISGFGEQARVKDHWAAEEEEKPKQCFIDMKSDHLQSLKLTVCVCVCTVCAEQKAGT